jgi:hypothetical protein
MAVRIFLFNGSSLSSANTFRGSLKDVTALNLEDRLTAFAA